MQYAHLTLILVKISSNLWSVRIIPVLARNFWYSGTSISPFPDVSISSNMSFLLRLSSFFTFPRIRSSRFDVLSDCFEKISFRFCSISFFGCSIAIWKSFSSLMMCFALSDSI